MKILLLLLLSATAKAAPPLAQYQTISGSTFTIGGFSNLPVFLSSSSFTGQAVSTFSVNAPTGSVVNCTISVIAITDQVDLYMTINGSVSGYGFRVFNTNANQGATGQTKALLVYPAINTNSSALVLIRFFQGQTSATEYDWTGTYFVRDATNDTIGTIGGFWTGGASAQTITLQAATEVTRPTMTGTVRCTYEKF